MSIPVFSFLALASAIAKSNADPQLFADVEKLYVTYAQLQTGRITLQQLEASGELVGLIEATARLANAMKVLVEDPAQRENLKEVLDTL